MKRIAAYLALTTVLGAVSVASAQDGGRKLTTTLTGAAEVPNKGDSDGSGTASVRVNVGQGTVCYSLTVMSIAPATGAHIHEAPVGVAGPVSVHLAAPTSGMSSGCVSVSREEAKDILKNPENYYVNIHNAEFPGGALRGQLSK